MNDNQNQRRGLSKLKLLIGVAIAAVLAAVGYREYRIDKEYNEGTIKIEKDFDRFAEIETPYIDMITQYEQKHSQLKTFARTIHSKVSTLLTKFNAPDQINRTATDSAKEIFKQVTIGAANAEDLIYQETPPNKDAIKELNAIDKQVSIATPGFNKLDQLADQLVKTTSEIETLANDIKTQNTNLKNLKKSSIFNIFQPGKATQDPPTENERLEL